MQALKTEEISSEKAPVLAMVNEAQTSDDVDREWTFGTLKIKKSDIHAFLKIITLMVPYAVVVSYNERCLWQLDGLLMAWHMYCPTAFYIHTLHDSTSQNTESDENPKTDWKNMEQQLMLLFFMFHTLAVARGEALFWDFVALSLTCYSSFLAWDNSADKASMRLYFRFYAFERHSTCENETNIKHTGARW